MHLLDDFLTIEPPNTHPIALELIKQIFTRLGVPLAPNKVFGHTQLLEFLGIVLDSDLMEARLSEQKVHKLQELISFMQPHRKCNKRQLLSLIGSLSFATKVILPGRPFLSRLIKLSTTAHQLDHFVYLNQGIREDLVMWSHFLQGWNGRSFFLEDEFMATPDNSLYTDASGVKDMEHITRVSGLGETGPHLSY